MSKINTSFTQGFRVFTQKVSKPMYLCQHTKIPQVHELMAYITMLPPQTQIPVVPFPILQLTKGAWVLHDALH